MKPNKIMAHRPNPAHDPVLDRLIAYAETHVRTVARQNGKLAPILFIQQPESVVGLGITPGLAANAYQWSAFVQYVRVLCIAVKARATVFITGTWFSIDPPGGNTDAEEARLSEPPHEREAVFLLGESICREIRCRILPIIRSDNGDFCEFAPVEEHQINGMVGQFASLLPDHPTSEKERTEAAASLSSVGVRIPLIKRGQKGWPTG